MKHRNHSRRRTQAGFSLIELLIVVAIVGILAAVAVPKLLRSLETGRETGVIQTLRAIRDDQAQFHVKKQRFGTLKELADEGLIDGSYASGSAVSGYIYTSTEATPDQYCIQATRQSGTTASRDFNIIEDGTIRYVESKSPGPIPHGGGTPLSDVSPGSGGATAPAGEKPAAK